MTRMLYLGQPSKKELERYNLLLSVQKKTIKNLRLNQSTKKVEEQVRRDLGKHASYFIHSLGHGVGVEIHEAPSFKDKETIKRNQTLTIEPGIYRKDFGMRIEDTLLMTKKPLILTKTSKSLRII